MRARMIVWLVLAALVGSVAPAFAWGTGAHLAIALGVVQAKGVTDLPRTAVMQVAYGSMAPDLAWIAWDPLRDNLGEATHFAPGDLEPLQKALTFTQRVFAYGWLSHNDDWGADYWAHYASPFGSGDGYVIDRAAAAAALGVPADVAQDYVEVAVDLLLDQQFPQYHLGSLVSGAASARSDQIPYLLARCYGDVPGSSAFVVMLLEGAFRTGIIQYGNVLALPTGADDALMAEALALWHGIDPADSAAYLQTAKLVCLDPSAPYTDAIAATIELVAAGPWPVW